MDPKAIFERFCRGCDQNLRGVDGTLCPECRRAFDPHDPLTFASEDRASRGRRRWKRAARWAAGFELLLAWAFAGLALLTVVGSFGPMLDWFRMMQLSALWGMAAFAFVGALIVRGVTVYSAPGAMPKARGLSAAAASAAFVVLFLWTNAPAHIGFALSRTELDALADGLADHDKVKPGMVGIYDIERATRQGERVELLIRGQELASGVWSLRRTAAPDVDCVIDLGGGWYGSELMPGRGWLRQWLGI